MKHSQKHLYRNKCLIRRDWKPADARERMTVALHDLITVASRHGLHVTMSSIHAAVRAGDLKPCSSSKPMRFDADEANRWLTILATAVIAAKEGR